MTDIQVTAILCTHNPRWPAFARVIQSLLTQTLEAGLWELVIVDNGSREPVSERMRNLALPRHTRIVLESRLGLTRARLTGMSAAAGKVIVLVDDDTVLAADYLACAKRIMDGEPHVGAMGGRIRAEFEVPPSRWMHQHLGNLAIRDFGDRPIRALIHNQGGPWEPCGAGMVLRKAVADEYLRQAGGGTRLRLDRVGRSLSSAGDTDIARTASDLGFYLGYEPGLSLTHLIPKGRVRFRYLLRLEYSIYRDGRILERLRGNEPRLTYASLVARLVKLPVATFTPVLPSWAIRMAGQLGALRGQLSTIDGARERSPAE